MKDKDIGSLEHTMWRCQYHVVFAPKYRRMVIYGEIKQDIGRILRQLCQKKGVEIIEAELCRDHVHISLFRKSNDVFKRRQFKMPYLIGCVNLYLLSATTVFISTCWVRGRKLENKKVPTSTDVLIDTDLLIGI